MAMRSYGRDEMRRSYEDLDEYEEDGEDYEDLEEAEEEEEDPKPTKDELDYLELRQRLKEAKRKQLKKENGSSINNSQEKKKKLPYDNYGSFFGPSQPVIAQRVIQESKSLLETQHLAARNPNPHHSMPMKKGSTSTPNGGARPSGRGPPPKVVQKASVTQKLKDNRDYSFLFSEEELPAPKKELPSRNVSAPNYDARSAQLASRSRQSTSDHSRPNSNGHGDRRLVSTNRQLHNKADPRKVLPASRPTLTASDPRRQLGSNSGNGPGRPMVTKSSSKVPASTKLPVSNRMQPPSMDRKSSSVGVKKPVPALQRAPLPSSKLHSGGQKQHLDQRRQHLDQRGQHLDQRRQHLDQRGQHLDQRREIREPDRAKQVPKQLVSSSRPQMKPPKQIQSRPPPQGNHSKKRPSRPFPDEDEDDQAISMIRNMFGYNPKRYAGVDDDDSDMEANFADIQREERRSAKIARQEDEEQLRLIEEEERREMLKKEAKKRKLR